MKTIMSCLTAAALAGAVPASALEPGTILQRARAGDLPETLSRGGVLLFDGGKAAPGEGGALLERRSGPLSTVWVGGGGRSGGLLEKGIGGFGMMARRPALGVGRDGGLGALGLEGGFVFVGGDDSDRTTLDVATTPDTPSPGLETRVTRVKNTYSAAYDVQVAGLYYASPAAQTRAGRLNVEAGVRVGGVYLDDRVKTRRLTDVSCRGDGCYPEDYRRVADETVSAPSGAIRRGAAATVYAAANLLNDQGFGLRLEAQRTTAGSAVPYRSTQVMAGVVLPVR